MSDWLKSGYSAPDGDCVEIGRGSGIRDGKFAGHLPAWSVFLAAVGFPCR